MQNSTKLYHLADKLNVDVLDLIKAAIFHGISYSPSEAEADILKRAVSGYYELPEADIRTIEDFLNSDKAMQVIDEAKEAVRYLSESEWDEYLGLAAERLYALLGESSLKRSIKPETIRETITNLGVIRIPRSSSSEPDLKPIPEHLLSTSPNIAEHVVRRYLLKLLERTPLRKPEDFEYLRQEVTEVVDRLRENYGST